jgi:DNA-binding FadR family transcriptional regulator
VHRGPSPCGQIDFGWAAIVYVLQIKPTRTQGEEVVTVYRRPDPIPRPAAMRLDRLRPLAVREDSTSLTQLVARRIFRAIEDGTFPEGSILPIEQELAVELGVSRTALREAVNALAAKGLVEARRRRGTQVLPRTNWNVLDREIIRWSRGGPHDGISAELWQVVRSLLPGLAAAAARRGSPGRLAAAGLAIAAAQRGWEHLAALDFLLELATLGRNRFLLSAVSTSLQSLARDDAPFLASVSRGITTDFAAGLVDAIVAGHEKLSSDLMTAGLDERLEVRQSDYFRAL